MDPNQNKKNDKNNRGRMRGVASLILWALVLVVVFQYINAYTGNAANKTTSHEIKYSQLIEMVKADEVKSIEFKDKTIYATPVDGYTFTDEDGKSYTQSDEKGLTLYTTELTNANLLALLDEHGVEYTSPYQAQMSPILEFMIAYILPTILMVGLFMLVLRMLAKNGGGGLGGILVMLVLPQFGYLLVPAAFGGALVTAVLVYLLAWKRGVNPVRLILAGVAVSAMLGAFSSTILILNAEKAGGVLDFTIGSLSARSWPQIEQVAPYMAAGFAVALMLGQKLNILTLGDEVATGLGMRVERTRFLLLAVAALLAASAVSVAGLLGFVGLIAPHIVRIVIGSDNRFLIPASALFGGIMVVGCDTVGRMAMDPSELPVGVIMSLLGPPFFLWLLRRHSYEA